MTKKVYCPMTIAHEALEMNQAVAGACMYRIAAEGKNCEDCSQPHHDNWSSDPHHQFSVFTNGDDIIGLSINNPRTMTRGGGWIGKCGEQAIVQGVAVVQTDNSLDTYFDPVPDSGNNHVIYQGDGEGSFEIVGGGSAVVYNHTS